MKEFIEELKHNQEINHEKGLANVINIKYVIDRLEEIYDDIENISKIEIVIPKVEED